MSGTGYAERMPHVHLAPAIESVAARCVLPVAWLLAGIASAGCYSADAPATFAVTDSAGVRIVTSARPLLSEAATWTVDSVPLLELGTPDDSASQFFRIQAVELLPDGGLVVLDGGSRELRAYSPEGERAWSFGGPGEGPGQFGQVSWVGRAPDGSFELWDRALARLTVASATGELVEVRRPTSAAMPIVYARTRSGRYLGVYPTPIPPPRPGTILADTLELWLLAANLERIDTVARLPGPIWVWTGQYQLPVPLTANPLRAIAGDAILTAAGPAAEVSVFDSLGTLEARFRLSRSPREVGAGELRDLVDARVEEGVYPGTPAVWREWFDRMPVPAQAPAFDRMVVASDGAIWLRRFELRTEGPTTWSVLRSDGVHLTDIVLPGGLDVMSVGDDRIAGVARDSLGVERVVVYGLDRGG